MNNRITFAEVLKDPAPHDASGIENPHQYLWEQVGNLTNTWYPVYKLEQPTPAQPADTKYFVIEVLGDVEPYLHGPFQTSEIRDAKALQLRKEDMDDLKNGLYMLNVSDAGNTVTVDAYSGMFFDRAEEEEEAALAEDLDVDFIADQLLNAWEFMTVTECIDHLCKTKAGYLKHSTTVAPMVIDWYSNRDNWRIRCSVMDADVKGFISHYMPIPLL